MKICACYPGQRVITPLGQIARVDGLDAEASHVELTYLAGGSVSLKPNMLRPCEKLVLFADELAALRSVYETKRGRKP